MVAAPDEARRLTVPAELGRMAEIRAFVRAALTDAGASADVVADAVQAVDEAATNVVVHGYAGAPGDIEIQWAVVDGHVELRLLDRAPDFDPTTVAVPDLSIPPLARRPGGMGVHLIRAATAQTQHHRRPGGGNELVLVCGVGPRRKEAPAMALSIDSIGADGAPGTTVLTLTGELDASNYETLIEAARTARASGATSLVLDLGGLTFMASSGLVALYSAVRIMAGEEPPDPEMGWGAIHSMEDDDRPSDAVRLANVQPAVERVLDRTGLRRLFHLDASRDAAVAALGGG
jgi:serine/threonine-protein kinase RsbW